MPYGPARLTQDPAIPISPTADEPQRAPFRRVYYFHGFDPATTTRYRRIFEATSARLGCRVGDLDGASGWRVERDGLVTEVHHCRYEDIVRAWQRGPLWKRVARGLHALMLYARDGALIRMARLAPGTLALSLSPLIFIVGAVILLIGVFALIEPTARGAAAGVAVTGAVLAVGIPVLYLHLVLDLFAYMRLLAHASGPVWRAFLDRVRLMSGIIEANGDEAEVVIVGHSLGGITAIYALDVLLLRWPAGRPIGLLTLGSTHGTVLVQQGDGRDRLAGAIGRIAADPRVCWVDVSSPRDSFCLPLLDPLRLIDARAGMKSPRVVSAALARAPRIPGDRRTLFPAMRRHMGYLLAPDGETSFDYADTVSGRESLAERFTARGDSPKARMWRG